MAGSSNTFFPQTVDHAAYIPTAASLSAGMQADSPNEDALSFATASQQVKDNHARAEELRAAEALHGISSVAIASYSEQQTRAWLDNS